MTSRERVKRTINFQGSDRMPHYLTDDKENDLLCLWMDGPGPIQDWTNYGEIDRMTDDWGTTYQRVAGGKLGRGEVLEPAIKEISRQSDYVMPDVNNTRYFNRARLSIEMNAAAQNPKYALGVMPFNSLNEGTHNLVGIQDMFLAYYEHPDNLKSLIGRLAEGQRESIRKLAEIGCDGIMGYDDWGLQDRLMVSTDLIEEFFMPHYRINWALAHELGMDVWLHSCGHIVEVLPKLIEAGLNVVQMDQQENMGLDLLSERFGGKIAFWCPVDIQATMVSGTLDDVRNYVRRMKATLGAHHGGLISKVYASPDDVDHSPEKIATMCKAFRE